MKTFSEDQKFFCPGLETSFSQNKHANMLNSNDGHSTRYLKDQHIIGMSIIIIIT